MHLFNSHKVFSWKEKSFLSRAFDLIDLVKVLWDNWFKASDLKNLLLTLIHKKVSDIFCDSSDIA